MSNPEEIVQRQLQAYNEHNIDAYVDTFSQDVQLFELPGNVETISGKAALRAYYAERFRLYPVLQGKVTQRMVLGNYVIYHEELYGLQADEAVELIAVYQVQDE